MMLSFLHSSRDYAAAKQFLPKRFNTDFGLMEFSFAWDIWLELGDEKALDANLGKLVSGTRWAEDPWMRGALCTSLGDYFMRRGQWRQAVESYQQIPVESGHAQQAVLGPLGALLGELISATGASREALDRFKNYHYPDV